MANTFPFPDKLRMLLIHSEVVPTISCPFLTQLVPLNEYTCIAPTLSFSEKFVSNPGMLTARTVPSEDILTIPPENDVFV